MLRYDIINHFIKKNNFKRYLEIGVSSGECIRQVDCDEKDGVDSGLEGQLAPETNYHMTSDEFFAQNQKIYDIVFIDGLHHSEQVNRDIENSLNCTRDSAIIILHDCSPPLYQHSVVPFPGNIGDNIAWTGDVYKSVLKFQKDNKHHTFFTVDTDWGVGVILKNVESKNNIPDHEYSSGIDNWNYFNTNRTRLLNMITPNQFVQMHYENN